MSTRWKQAVTKIKEKISRGESEGERDAEFSGLADKVTRLASLAEEARASVVLLIDSVGAYATESARLAGKFAAYFEAGSMYGLASAAMLSGARAIDARIVRHAAQLRSLLPLLDAFDVNYAEIKKVLRKRDALAKAYNTAAKGGAKGKTSRGIVDDAWSTFSAFNESAKADLAAFHDMSIDWFAPVFDCIARAHVYAACIFRDAYLSDVASHVSLVDLPAVPTNPFKASSLTLNAIDAGLLDPPSPQDVAPWDVQDTSLDISDSLAADDVLRLEKAPSLLPTPGSTRADAPFPAVRATSDSRSTSRSTSRSSSRPTSRSTSRSSSRPRPRPRPHTRSTSSRPMSQSSLPKPRPLPRSRAHSIQQPSHSITSDSDSNADTPDPIAPSPAPDTAAPTPAPDAEPSRPPPSSRPLPTAPRAVSRPRPRPLSTPSITLPDPPSGASHPEPQSEPRSPSNDSNPFL